MSNSSKKGLPEKSPSAPTIEQVGQLHGSCPLHWSGKSRSYTAKERHSIPEEQHRHPFKIARPQRKVCKAMFVTSLSTPCVPLSWSIGVWSSPVHSPRQYQKSHRGISGHKWEHRRYLLPRRLERTRPHFNTMLGFSLPLYVLLGIELTLAGLLCLPLPLSRPAVFIVRLTKHQVMLWYISFAYLHTHVLASGSKHASNCGKFWAFSSFSISGFVRL